SSMTGSVERISRTPAMTSGRLKTEKDTDMDRTIGVLARYGYLVVFGSILAEQIGLPFPAIPFLLAAGAPAGPGKLSFALLPPLAGIVRMPLGRFVVFSALGGLFWAGAFIALGWIFARQLEIVADYAVRLGSWTLVLIGAALGGYIAWKYCSRQRFLRKIRIA